MTFVTDFADLAVILPLAVLVAGSFAAIGWRREAFAWTVAVGSTLAAVFLLKMVIFAHPDALLADWSLGGGLSSPSGHTAAGTVVYAGLLTLAAQGRTSRRFIALLTGGALAAAFGVTRLVVGQHSLADVIVGAVVGLAGVWLLVWLASTRPTPASHGRLALPAAATLIALMTFHGQRLPAEQALRAVATQLWLGAQ
jgi:membrane-associated phospholipid phosphatase